MIAIGLSVSAGNRPVAWLGCVFCVCCVVGVCGALNPSVFSLVTESVVRGLFVWFELFGCVTTELEPVLEPPLVPLLLDVCVVCWFGCRLLVVLLCRRCWFVGRIVRCLSFVGCRRIPSMLG